MLNKLRRIVESNCISKNENTTILAYWSDVVFAKCVFALAPLSLLAIIPAIIICLQTESYLILWFNVFCFGMLIFVGYVPGASVKTRKILLITLLFVTALVLLEQMGTFGPGLVYLLSATVISLLLFPGKKTFLPFILTCVFCVFYGFLIHWGLVEIHALHDDHVMEWIAVSSNVLFMSALFTFIIPFFFSKLEEILGEKVQLLESVNQKNLELNKVIEEVNSKNSELEQFAFIASHDMQEPLRMITTFMDKLKRKLGTQLDEKTHQYIFFATDGANRMRQIILDLLEYSRAGKHTEAMEEINFNEVLQEYKELRRNIINTKKAKISAGELPVFYSYRVAIVQIFHSLLDNAIKYSRNDVNPVIEISIIEGDNEWKFAIKDNGIGISPEFYDKIFITFQRLHNRNEYDGTGIGLSIAKKHVESLGGKIWLESTLGEGSTFYFTLPKN